MNRSEISLNAPRASQEMRRDTFAVLALGLAPAIGLGIARFAYALVLPDMRADLNWSYAEAGWLNASNAAGYLIGAMLCARAIERAGAYRVMAAGVWACVLALALCATTRETVTLNGARALAGWVAALPLSRAAFWPHRLHNGIRREVPYCWGCSMPGRDWGSCSPGSRFLLLWTSSGLGVLPGLCRQCLRWSLPWF